MIDPDQLLKNNFPFGYIRPKQEHVPKDIPMAFDSGVKFVILEAPTGFGLFHSNHRSKS